MVIEHLHEWNLWQVMMITAEGQPEDVFLLENVEQILIGPDRKVPSPEQSSTFGLSVLRMTRKASGRPEAANSAVESGKYYALFCMRSENRREIQSVYVVLPDAEEKDRFCATIEKIHKKSIKCNYKQFITPALTCQAVPNFLKAQSRFYPYLQTSKEKFLRNMQDLMRKTQTRPDTNEDQR